MEAGAGVGRGTPRRPSARALVLLVAAGIAGLGIGLALHFALGGRTAASARSPQPVLHGQASWAAGARPAPLITMLHDQSGRAFSLAALRGRTVAMTFFDSHCTQACPLEGRALAEAERSLPAAQRPVLVIVSVNPLDTSASVRRAVRRWGLGRAGRWYWLMGTHSELARTWHSYRIFVAPTKGDITHTEALYLIDRHGYERSGYLYPFVPRFVSGDLRLLAAGVRHA